MKPFKNKLAVTIIVLSVTFLSIILYSVGSGNNSVSGTLGSIMMPIQKVVYNLNTRIKNVMNFATNFEEIQSENNRLKEENGELEGILLQYSDLADENEELRSILEFKNVNENYNYVGCNIVGYSGGNILDGYIIDKGTDDGIKEDMVVINSSGLVGKVTKSESNFSIVETILSQNVAVSALSQNSVVNTGILRGIKEETNEDLVKLYNLPIDSDIKEGDIILTSGLGMIYPKDIKIGEVVSVEVDNVMVMKNAIVKPHVEFEKLDKLFVIVPKNESEEIKYN